jgi:hypothetical protein
MPVVTGFATSTRTRIMRPIRIGTLVGTQASPALAGLAVGTVGRPAGASKETRDFGEIPENPQVDANVDQVDIGADPDTVASPTAKLPVLQSADHRC